jgi:hypothetical protein
MSPEDIKSTPKQEDRPRLAQKHTEDPIEDTPAVGTNAAPDIHLKTVMMKCSEYLA